MSIVAPHSPLNHFCSRQSKYLFLLWFLGIIFSFLFAEIPSFAQGAVRFLAPQQSPKQTYLYNPSYPQSPALPSQTTLYAVSPFEGQRVEMRGYSIPAAPASTHVAPITMEPVSMPAGSTPILSSPIPSLPRLEETSRLPIIGQEELNLVIQEGQTFEAGERWSEALVHYEAALRTYRNDNALMTHYRVARFHCDVGRRSADTSYLNLLKTLTAIESLNFFENVLTQIQKEYADAPQWDQLFRHGMQSFGIALKESNFRKNVNLHVSIEQINSCLSNMQTTADGWKIRNREDIKNGMLYMAEAAQKQVGLNPVIAIMEFTCGVVGSLDPNTAYLTPSQLNDQYSTIFGNLVGLGVELKTERDSLLIVRVIPGSPAEEGGLKEGDQILSVNGTSTRGEGNENVADLLQGEEGTTAKLTIVSAGLGQFPREVSITRRYIEVPSVEDVHMINDTLGYVKLTGFQSKTSSELATALSDLEHLGMKCLVLDLRRNPGGLFNIGVDVASMFINQGAIVRTRGRDREMDSPCMATAGKTWNVPLIVLIDEESASASEIVAGAIRDHQRGVLIGKQSYGKGTIQKIIPVPAGTPKSILSGVKLTTEKFYSPQGWAYSGVGVTPHIVIKENGSRVTLAKPWEGRMPLQLPRPISSSLDDPFIQEAVKVSQNLIK